MANMDTTTNAENLPVEYYERKLLQTLEPRLVLQPLGRPQNLPKHWGQLVKWLRYSAVAGSTTPLSEGVTPAESSVTTANVTATIAQYGQYAIVTDQLSDTAIDPVIENLAERFGFGGAKTIEQLCIDELDAEASDQFAAGAANADAITASDVLSHEECIKAMINQKKDEIGPHESGSFVVVMHPASEFDMLSDTQAGSFVDVRKYDQSKDLLRGEVGRMYGMRFIVSDLMSDAAKAITQVYNNYVIGEEAFGVVKLDNKGVTMKIKKHGSSGTSDPLDQRATVGYKLNGFVCKYLDSGTKRVINVQTASAI